MTSFDDLLSQVPIGQIADKLGVDKDTATNAVKAALPTLLGGLQAKTGEQPEGVASLVGSPEDHGDLLDGGVDIDQVDTKAGAEIVDNVFGDEKNTVISALGATGDTGGKDLIAKVLPMLAPIVMAYLAKQMSGGGQQQSSAGGGAIGDILGGLLGGSSKSGGIGGAIGDALAKNAGGALGNVLGGLFGRKG
ncbi:DUF937 domain-containing protein [Nocardia sp. NPDC052566]|uniref:DUF937 domain-containing protein n=1 Tax=Nocardia sp. NPDC052566 TaxID=3364330 RepID=UPI0037C4F2B4